MNARKLLILVGFAIGGAGFYVLWPKPINREFQVSVTMEPSGATAAGSASGQLASKPSATTAGDEVMEAVRLWGKAVRARHKAEQADRAEGDRWSAARDKTKQAFKDYSDSCDTIKTETAKAIQANGDPAQDFVAVQAAIKKSKELEAAANQASEEERAVHKHFDEVRSRWFKLMDAQALAGGLINEEVNKAVGGAAWSGDNKSMLLRIASELKLVNELLDGKALSPELTDMVNAYSKASTELQAAIRDRIALPSKLWKDREAYEKQLAETLAKPGPDQAQKLTALREVGRKLLDEEQKFQQLREEHLKAEQRFDAAQKAYTEPLVNVVIHAPGSP